MENTLELFTKFGLGYVLTAALVYWGGIILKWVLSKQSKQMDDNHKENLAKMDNLYDIIVKLIDKTNRLDDDIGGMAGKLDYERRKPPL